MTKTMALSALKLKLSEWEKKFEKTHQRRPTPTDVQACGLSTLHELWFFESVVFCFPFQKLNHARDLPNPA